LLSIFTFKKELKKVFSPENIEELKNLIVRSIASYVNVNLLGADKKEKVVRIALAFVSAKMQTDNGIVKFFVQLLIQFVPNIVQYLYDALKACVVGLTEKPI